MSTAVSSILARVYILLLDEDRDAPRWVDTELVAWASDAERDICIAKPEANSKVSTLAMAAGTRQSLPADCLLLLDVVRNMGADGLTPGSAVRVASRDAMDSCAPGWHAATPADTVKNWMYDPRTPRHFYTYPPQNGTGNVELVYSALPPLHTSAAENIAVADQYATAMVDYVCYRAFSKDGEYGNAGRASGHLQAFMSAIGLRTGVEAGANPNLAALPFNPGSLAAAS